MCSLLNQKDYLNNELNDAENDLNRCLICQNDKGLKNLDSHCNEGNIENYVEIISSCFNIQFWDLQRGSKDLKICEDCIDHLKMCFLFRKKVEKAYNNLLYVTSNKIKCDEIKIEFCSSFENLPTIFNENSKSSNSLLDEDSTTADNIEQEEPTDNLFLDSKLDNENNSTRPEKKNINTHDKVLNLESTVCSICKKSFKSYHLLLPHYDEHFTKSKTKTKVLSQCKKRSRKHSKAHLNPQKNYTTKVTKEKYSKSDEDFSVDSDELDVATGHNRIPHPQRHVKPVLEPSCKECPICFKSFVSFSLLSLHFNKHSPEFLCEICGSGFKTFICFKEHKNTHLNLRFPCSLCSKTYASKNSVIQHVKTFHKNIKLFICYLCPLRFNNSVSRRKHLSDKHGVECAMHPCLQCGKKFFSAHLMRKHYNRSHLKLKTYSCTECDKKFITKAEATDHMSKHTGVKSHHCDICGKYFVSKKSLVEHLKIHKNIKKHVCEVCDKAFVQKCALKSHTKTHHKV